MRWFRRSSDSPSIDWKPLTSEDQFSTLLEGEDIVAVFKHSTRCSISSMAMARLEREWTADIPLYIVDVIAHRGVSNEVEARSGIMHQSPQFIIFRDGKVVYSASHTGINAVIAMDSLELEKTN